MSTDRRINAWAKWALEGTPENALKRLEGGDAYFREQLESGPAELVVMSLAQFSRLGQQWFYRRCFEGDESCWDDLPRYASYEALRYSVKELKEIRDPAPFAIILLDAIARGIDVRAARLAKRIEDRLRVGRRPWPGAITAPFAVALHDRFKRTESQVKVPAPYDAVFAAWDASDAYAAACRTCVEYHLDNGQVGESGNDDFSGLFALIPVEFAALKRVRDRQGLPTPAVEHPFFETPLARYPEAIERPYDPRKDPLYVATVERVLGEPTIKNLGLDLYDI